MNHVKRTETVHAVNFTNEDIQGLLGDHTPKSRLKSVLKRFLRIFKIKFIEINFEVITVEEKKIMKKILEVPFDSIKIGDRITHQDLGEHGSVTKTDSTTNTIWVLWDDGTQMYATQQTWGDFEYVGPIKIRQTSEDNYVSQCGCTVQREYGLCEDGIFAQGKWVFRKAGKYIDRDMYINDLAERNNIKIDRG